jgi:hypothetical protein
MVWDFGGSAYLCTTDLERALGWQGIGRWWCRDGGEVRDTRLSGEDVGASFDDERGIGEEDGLWHGEPGEIMLC